MGKLTSAKDDLGPLKYNQLCNELRECVDISDETIDKLYFVAKTNFIREPGLIVPSAYSDDDFIPTKQPWKDISPRTMANLIIHHNAGFFFLEFVKLIKKNRSQ